MNDQLEVLKQGPLFLAHVLGLRWVEFDPALCMACGAWVADSALDFKAGLFSAVFGAEGAEVRLPGAPAVAVRLPVAGWAAPLYP